MIYHGKRSTEKLISGAKQLNQATSATLGPKARNVAISQIGNPPLITKDGATVARFFELEDKEEQDGVERMRQVGLKTANTAGDNSTTAILLGTSTEIFGNERISPETDVYGLGDGIIKDKETAIAELTKMAIPVKTLKQKIQVATISANNNPELGKIVGELVHKVGSAPIDIVDGDEYGVVSEITEGLSVDRGPINPLMLDSNQEALLEDPVVFITDQRFIGHEQIDALLGALIGQNKKTLLLVADGYDDAAKQFLTRNHKNVESSWGPGIFNLIAIESPGFGDKRRDYSEDLAYLTGATLVDVNYDWTEVDLDVLGSAAKVTSGPEITAIIGGKGETKERVAQLNKQLTQTKSAFDKDQLRIRIGKLTTGVGILKVATASAGATENLKLQLEDAVRATQVATEEGIVPGGGYAFYRISKLLDREGVMAQVLQMPLLKIAENACADPQHIKNLADQGIGYNAKTGETGDLIKMGVVDTVLGLKTALENGVTEAVDILTVGVYIGKIEK